VFARHDQIESDAITRLEARKRRRLFGVEFHGHGPVSRPAARAALAGSPLRKVA